MINITTNKGLVQRKAIYDVQGLARQLLRRVSHEVMVLKITGDYDFEISSYYDLRLEVNKAIEYERKIMKQKKVNLGLYIMDKNLQSIGYTESQIERDIDRESFLARFN